MVNQQHTSFEMLGSTRLLRDWAAQHTSASFEGGGSNVLERLGNTRPLRYWAAHVGELRGGGSNVIECIVSLLLLIFLLLLISFSPPCCLPMSASAGGISLLLVSLLLLSPPRCVSHSSLPVPTHRRFGRASYLLCNVDDQALEQEGADGDPPSIDRRGD